MELSKAQLYRETFDAALAFDALRLPGGIFAGRNLRKQRGLPREAVFADRELHDAFALTLAPLGVECRSEPGHPLFEDLKESMQEWMGSSRPEPSLRTALVMARARACCQTAGPADGELRRRSPAAAHGALHHDGRGGGAERAGGTP